MDIDDIISKLRIEGSDNGTYEVKSAVGGFSDSIMESVCAFANSAGGGYVILGVDENLDFEAVEIYDLKKCQQTIAQKARTECKPSVKISSKIYKFEGKNIILVTVFSSPKQALPVEFKGQAFIRQYDGDYKISNLEKEIFISNKGMPDFDTQAVDGTSKNDLNVKLTEEYITLIKESTPPLQQCDDDEILFRTGIIKNKGNCTAAGLLALGIYPQQYFVNYSIQASVQKKSNETLGVRSINTKSIAGPIGSMLEQAVDWVRENSNVYTTNLPNGHVMDVMEYPLDAVREIIANSLIHRDLNPMSFYSPISLIMKDDKLIISNNGGLFGIGIDELGRTASKLRNPRLAETCQYVKIDNKNVVERLGTGIPTIRESLSMVNMYPAKFIDGGIYFTVVISNQRIQNEIPRNKNIKSNSNIEVVLGILSDTPVSKNEIGLSTGLTKSQVRYSIEKLLKSKEIKMIGTERSKNAKYVLA
jgi:ATP-dependent DNA helicase RecG